MRDILDRVRRDEWISFVGEQVPLRDKCAMTNGEAGQALTALFGSPAETYGSEITEILNKVRRDEWHGIRQHYELH